MRAGVSTACFYPLELENAFEALASRGVRIAEIFVNTDSELHDPYLSEMLAVQREYGVKVGSVHPYTCPIEPMMLFSSYERRLTDMIEYYKHLWEYMNKFGAKYFIFHGNKVQHLCPEERYFERFLAIQNAAEEFGVTVVQENVAYCMSKDPDFLGRMSAELGEKASFVLDTKQAHRAGYDPLDFVKALGDRIVHVHYSDHGRKGDCLKFDDGEYDNHMFFSELKKCGFKGNAVIELYKGSYDSADDLADNYKKLDNFLKENSFSE